MRSLRGFQSVLIDITPRTPDVIHDDLAWSGAPFHVGGEWVRSRTVGIVLNITILGYDYGVGYNILGPRNSNN